MMFAGIPPVLYFFYQDSCQHCAEAMPIVERFGFAHGRSVSVIKLNVGIKPDWEKAGYSPKATPAYALVQNGELLAKHEGKLTEAQLKRFVER